MVPNVNALPEHFKGIGELAKSLPNAKGFEIMPYHRLGESKLDRLGLGTSPIKTEPPEKEEFNMWIDTLKGYGVNMINARK